MLYRDYPYTKMTGGAYAFFYTCDRFRTCLVPLHAGNAAEATQREEILGVLKAAIANSDKCLAANDLKACVEMLDGKIANMRITGAKVLVDGAPRDIQYLILFSRVSADNVMAKIAFKPSPDMMRAHPSAEFWKPHVQANFEQTLKILYERRHELKT